MEASKYFQVKENYIARGGDIKRGRGRNRKERGRRGDGEEGQRGNEERVQILTSFSSSLQVKWWTKCKEQREDTNTLEVTMPSTSQVCLSLFYKFIYLFIYLYIVISGSFVYTGACLFGSSLSSWVVKSWTIFEVRQGQGRRKGRGGVENREGRGTERRGEALTSISCSVKAM